MWNIAPQPYRGEHYATFPEELAELCIAAGCPKGGTVLDPCMGVGTTGIAARRLGRRFIGIDIKPEYVAEAGRRLESARKTISARVSD